MRRRQSISKSLRFSVLHRDGFACRYCGAKPPEVRLEVDHIHPHAKGGGDDYHNLATACQACNSGKSDEVLEGDLIEGQREYALAALIYEVCLERFRSLALAKPDLFNRILDFALSEPYAGPLINVALRSDDPDALLNGFYEVGGYPDYMWSDGDENVH